ncbi:MAG: metal ABC transporter permease [Limnochordia bacterium]|jgi:zinc transport system permease protein
MAELAERLALFSLPFMQRAVVSLLVASVTLSLLGIVVVVFNLSALRFALMHLGLLGATAALISGLDPLILAMVSITGGSLLFGPVSDRAKLNVGMTSALFMTGSLAVSFLLLYKANIPAMDAFSIFTGSILMLSGRDVWITLALGVCVVFIMSIWYWEVNLVLYNKELAAALGVRTGLVHYSLLVLLGLAIGVAMRLVGALMVDAIVLIPATAALPRARSLKQAMIFTAIFGLVQSGLGLLVAVVWDLPISATVALVGVLVLAGCQLIRLPAAQRSPVL